MQSLELDGVTILYVFVEQLQEPKPRAKNLF